MICVFDIGNNYFEGNGNAVLTPTDAKVKMVAGGNYDLAMNHPMDPDGKWRHLVPGAVVRVPIPEEEIENAFAGYAADVYKTTEEAALRESPSEPTAINYSQWNWQQAYEVGDKVSVSGWSHRNYECTYYDGGSQTIMVPPYNSSWWKAINDTTGGAAVLVTLPAGTELYFIEDVDATWYKMSTYYGIEGYIKKSQVEFWKHLTPEETKPRIIREQLFRIVNATADTKSHVVNVTAQHVSYDLNGIIVQDVSIKQASPAMAIGRMVEGFMIPYDGTIATNLTSDDNGTYTDDIKGKTGMYCFLDPDKGIVGKFDAALKRDNWDLFILQKTNTNRGFSIRYRKNLLGVSWARKSDGLITRVVPVAKDEKGEALYLPEKWIDSDYINDYPVIRMERLSMKEQVGKDKGTGDGSTWTLSDLYDEMRAKAAERFTVDKVDRIVDEVTVDFEQLGDTDEHAALKGFEKVLLYDAVTVIHEDIGLNMVMTVNELEWDAIRQKITSVKVSNVGNRAGRSVTGYNVQNKSIGWQKLTDDVGDDILNQVRDIIPEYADPEAPRPAIPVMNTKTQDGYVLKGGSNANKVWGTDASGNPGWTTPAAYTLPLAADGTRGGIQIGYTQSGKNYPVQLSGEKAFVNVPWTDTTYGNATQSTAGLMSSTDKTKLDGIEAQANKYVLPQATSGALGGIKIGWTGTGKDYPVELDSNGKAHVVVPWTDTTYTLPLAASGTRGGIQIGYSESGKKYAVKLDSEKAYVEVPWTADGGNAATVNGKTVAANVPADAKFTDHEYTAGTGLSLSNGQFAVRLAYSTSGKNYAVAADGSGNLYVNVPWTADGGAAATAVSFASAKSVELTGDTTGSASSTGGWSISTTTDQLTYKSQITSLEALDAFGVDSNIRVRVARVSRLSGAGYGENDGMIISVPWSSQYGHQFFVDDSGYELWHRYLGGGAWKDWKKILDSSRLNYPTSGKNYAVQMDGDGLYVNVPWSDTNTWRPVQNNLTSTSTTDSLSAAQGKILNDILNTITFEPYSGTGVTSYEAVPAGNYRFSSSEASAMTDKPDGVTGRTYLMKSKSGDENFMILLNPKSNTFYIKSQYGSWNTWDSFVKKSGDTMTGNFTNTGNITNTGYFTNNGSVLVYPASNAPTGSGGKITAFNTTRGFNIALQASSGGGSLSSTGYWNGSAYIESSMTILERSTDGKAYFHGDSDTVDGKHASDFVLKSGDTMTGTLNFQAAVNNVGVNFRPDNATYYTTISYQTAGNEAAVFATKNGVTSWIFINGEDSITNHATDRWKSLTPGLQIKNNCVRIGGLWGNDVTPDYKLRVDGTSLFSDGITVKKAGDAMVASYNSNTGVIVYLDTGASTNHGIYSNGYNNGTSFVSSAMWMIYRNSAGTVTVNGNCTGSAGSVAWSGVTSRPLQYFGGSGTNSVTITFPGSGHALMGLASGVGVLFIAGPGSLYSTLPSGFSATCASGTYKVTISRSNSTTFYFHGLYLAGTTELPVS